MSSTIELMSTGILMGIVHVLTGPDHLSALATLSGTSISSHRHLTSFLLGIKWGLGHSFGLLVVGGILIAMEEGSNEEWIGMESDMSRILESFVGVFMLALGCYGLCKAYRHRREATVPPTTGISRGPSKASLKEFNDNDHEDDDEESCFMEVEKPFDHRRSTMESTEIISQMAEVLNRDGDSMRSGGRHFDQYDEGLDNVERRIFHAAQSLRQNYDDDNDEESDEQFMMRSLEASGCCGALSKSFMTVLTSERPEPPVKAAALVHDHASPENCIVLDDPPVSYSNNKERRCSSCFMGTPGVLAIMAGILHGVAGPGGVLGVIPAVQLRNAKLAFVYLSTFCLTSTLAMGCFSMFYGRFSEWLAGGRRGGGSSSRVFVVEVGSAFLSIAVGIVWLVLLSIGKLEDIFP